MRRARRHLASHGGLPDRLALGKRGGKGKPALHVVQPGQRRAGERAERSPALLAAEAAKTARIAPRHRPAGTAVRETELVINAQLNR